MMFDTDAMRGAEQTTGQMQNLSLGDAGAGQDPFPASGGVTQLVELFPSYDTGVLEAILASCDGNVEAAIASLLDMGSASESGPVPDDSGAVAAQVNADEELALALFRQFAEELDESIPEEVRADPDQYEAYAREHYDQFVEDQGAQGAGGSTAAPSARVFKKLGGFKMSSLVGRIGKKKNMAFTSIEGMQQPLVGDQRPS